MGEADVQKAARRLAARLSELRIPYAICGGLAVTAHGHVRVTQDVDVLLTREGLAEFKRQCLGLGWIESFPGSKGVRDVEHRVRIDVLVAGDYPGDGRPKDVAFPDPAVVGVDIGDARILDLPVLIELKIASGVSAPDRPRDLDDVIQLIRANGLAREFSARLEASVRAKYEELWEYAQLRTDEQ